MPSPVGSPSQSRRRLGRTSRASVSRRSRSQFSSSRSAAGALCWTRQLGVRYVVLTDAPTDYSAKEEARLIGSGHSDLVRVLRTEHITIFSVPRPRPLLTGSAPAEVLALAQTYMLLHVEAPGR